MKNDHNNPVDQKEISGVPGDISSFCFPFWSVITIFIVIVLLHILCQLVVMYLLDGGNTEFAKFFSSRNETSIFIVLAIVFTFFLTAFFVLLAKPHGGIFSCLCVDWPDWKKIIWATGIAAFILVFEYFACRQFGVDPITPWQRKLFSSTTANGMFFLFIAVVICAPWCEELIFRGLLAPCLSKSILGIPGAAILSAVPWAFLHIQYNHVIMMIIFIIGVILGVIRLRTASLTLTIYIHAIINLVGYIVTILAVNGILD